MTQRERIASYLRAYGSISPLEAFRDLGITKLATRISEMRRDGAIIIGEPEETKNRFGERVTYMRYRFQLPFEEENHG